MKLLKGAGEFFALDIGTNAIRMVQLAPVGRNTWSLKHFGYGVVDAALTSANSKESERRLGETILAILGQSGIKTKNVVIGLPSQKTFTTVIDIPLMTEAELRSTIKYQIDQYIPMNNTEAKVDWVSLGKSVNDPTKQEVLIASTANSYAEQRLEFIESLGFNVIAAEPDPIAMVRSLLPEGAKDAQVLIDMGEMSSNLVVSFADAPRLVRTIPTGFLSLTKAISQNLNVQDTQARQFILKFGLASDRLEGQVYHAVEGTLDSFATELIKSIKFFQTKYTNIPVQGIYLAGYSGIIPLFGEYVASRANIQCVVANPWQKVQLSQAATQQLAPVSAEFATVVGLAQREAVL